MLEEIDKRVYEIESVLSDNEELLYSCGLCEGILGASLFYFYFYHFTKDETQLHKVSYYIDVAIQHISNNNVNELELIEFGKYLCFLNSNGFIDNEDAISYLEELDIAFKEFSGNQDNQNNLDSMSGIIAVGHYYLCAMPLINYKKEVEKIIELIETLAIENESDLFWQFSHSETKKLNIELGISHGISGVINFLILAFNQQIKTEECLRMINKGIRYILKFAENNGTALFPVEVLSRKRLQYCNLAYGDIGIGYVIFKSGIIIKNSQYIDTGLNIIENSARFRDNHNRFIKDAELIYGSSGLHTIFDFFYDYNKNPLFLEVSEYWLSKTLSHNENDTKWAGYDTYINGFYNYIQLSFSHGLCGIGISLMGYKLREKFNYLQFLNF